MIIRFTPTHWWAQGNWASPNALWEDSFRGFPWTHGGAGIRTPVRDRYNVGSTRVDNT